MRHSTLLENIFNSLSLDDYKLIEFSDLDPNQLMIEDKEGKKHLIEIREGKF